MSLTFVTGTEEMKIGSAVTVPVPH